MSDERSTGPSNQLAMRARPAAMALVMGLAAFTASASEIDLVKDIQRYCTVCWRNAQLDPGLWDDCTQEVCCRLLEKARAGNLDLHLVLAEDSQERRELIRAIDMVRKRVLRARRFLPLGPDESIELPRDQGRQNQERLELGELLLKARQESLSVRQDQIIELWCEGWTVPQISSSLNIPPERVSDEKYKALRKLERYLAEHAQELGLDHALVAGESPRRQVG